MRGEHFLSSISQGGEAGSSPHARGAHQVGIWACVELGLIPACAGSTPQRGDRVQIWVAHPRMRGEHMNVFWFTYPVEGSSPHARGALPEVGEVPDLERLIPACAGSTPVPVVPRSVNQAHPRMRGEHPALIGFTPAPGGSSPHARGARGEQRVVIHLLGLIPACAGSTPSLLECGPGGGAHPRMRGEHDHPCGVVPRVRGSSPHARGARARHLLVERIKGLIPACAGSTAPAHD